jgi:hypothetical protein
MGVLAGLPRHGEGERRAGGDRPQLQGVADGGVAGDLGAVGKPGELRWAAGAGWHLLVGDIDSDVAEHALVVVGV